MSGIYMITCIITGKAYIGKTIGNIRNRVMVHLNGGTPGCAALYGAIKKYGKENFTWEVLHENVIPELLSMFEMEAIKSHNTISPNGYNLTAGGETGFQSEETIRKRTETLKANPPMKGKKHTPETRAKMSKSQTGSKRSPETCRRISQSAMGHEVDSETRQKISIANTGKKHTEEWKQQASERFSGEGNPMYGKKGKDHPAYGNKHSKETRLKISEAQKGKILSDEHKHNLAEINSLPEKSAARELFFLLPSDMNLAEVRKKIFAAFPNVKRGTINYWLREWGASKQHKPGMFVTRIPEYYQTHEIFLSLPPEMSIVEKRQYLHKNVKGVHKGTISRWVKQWTNTIGKQPTHPDYERAQAFFLSLPSDMNLNKKISLFRKEFPHVSTSSVSKWIKKWTGETMPTGAPSHPERPAVHEYFLSLPLDMDLKEKRKRILEKFENAVHRPLVNRWTARWQSELKKETSDDKTRNSRDD